MVTAPDYIEPVEAWRIWLVVRARRGIALRSVFFRQLWSPGEAAIASCGCRRRRLLTPWRSAQGHEAPELGCDCGIYGAVSLADVITYLDRETPARFGWAVGRVALWGRVVECRSGWRGSHAYPRRLVVPVLERSPRPRPQVGPDESAEALLAYGVPVELFHGGVAELLEAVTA